MLALFENAKIKFTTNAFPNDHVQDVTIHPDVSAENEDLLEKRSISSFFQGVWSSVKKLGITVADIVKAATIGVKILVGQPYSASKEWTFPLYGWNYNKDSKQAASAINFGNGVTCTNCFASLDFVVDFQLDIANRKLNHLKLEGFGDAKLNIGSDFSIDYPVKKSNSFGLGRIDFKPIVFSIAGIPMIINISIPIEGGYNFQARIVGNFASTIKVEGKLGCGFEYSPQTGSQWLTIRSFEKSGTIESMSAKVSADLVVYILPTVIVNVDYIGGPYLGSKFMLESSAMIDLTNKDCASHIVYSLNWGLFVTIGALIDINLAGVNIFTSKWDPYTLYSIKKPITSGCVSFGRNDDPNVPLLDDKPAAVNLKLTNPYPGSTFHGSVGSANRQDCVYGELSLQYVGELTNSSYVFVGSYHIMVPQGARCVVQTMYYATERADKSFIFNPVYNSDGTEVLFEECDSKIAIQAIPHVGTFSDDLVTLTINTPNCPSSVLKRV